MATKIYVDFGQGGGQASTVVFGIGRCGSCGDGGGAAPRISMVDGVESKQLREGPCLRAMGEGVGGGRVLSSDEAGGGGNNYGRENVEWVS